jgi:hypothetical protein
VKNYAYSKSGKGAPAEVALCLSYYEGVNVPRRRGRVYFGPWAQAAMAARPEADLREVLRVFGAGLAGLGGVNVDWQLVSPTNNTRKRITHIWVDDSWDTQRRRGPKSTTRVLNTVQ